MNLDEVKQAVADGDLDAVEEAWMTAVEEGAPVAQLREVLSALVAAEQVDTAHTLAWMLLSETAEQRGDAAALDIARTILPVLPGNDELRITTADLYRRVHGEAENFDPLLRAAGLEDTQSPRRAIQTLEACLSARPGAFLANRFDGTVVRVESFDPVLGEYALVSPEGRRSQLEPKLLADEFEPVDDSDFRVLQGFRREELGEFLQKDPAAVLTGICRSRGGQVDATSLKALLVPAHIQADKWSGWWNRARTAAKRCEQLSLESGHPTVMRYHPGGRTLEEELSAGAAEARTPLDYLAVLREYAREAAHRKVAIAPAFAAPLVEKLAEQAAAFVDHRPVDALTASLALDAAAELGLPAAGRPHPSSADVLRAAADPGEAVAQLSEPSLWPAALDALAALDDAVDHLDRLLAVAPADQLDEIASRLRAAGRDEAVERVVAQALAEPKKHLQVCLWLWQGPAEGVKPAPSALDLLSRLLGATDDIHRDWDMPRERRRDAFHQIRAALTAEDCAAFRRALEEMDDGVAATIKRRIERSAGLSPTSRGELLKLLRKRFRGLFAQEQRAAWLDESVLWTTAEGMRRREEELKELLDVKIPANSRAIGAAAEMGDLSENSEWQYAIEEQRRLQARAAQIQNDMSRARVLHHDDVPADSVGIGSRVALKRRDSEGGIELTILGPWDSDVDRRVFSYKSALAQALLGKSPGEAVTLKIEGAEGEYVIERAAPAL